MFVWSSTNLYAEELKNSGNYGTNSGKMCSLSGKRKSLKYFYSFKDKDTEYIQQGNKLKPHDKTQNQTT